MDDDDNHTTVRLSLPAQHPVSERLPVSLPQHTRHIDKRARVPYLVSGDPWLKASKQRGARHQRVEHLYIQGLPCQRVGRASLHPPASCVKVSSGTHSPCGGEKKQEGTHQRVSDKVFGRAVRGVWHAQDRPEKAVKLVSRKVPAAYKGLVGRDLCARPQATSEAAHHAHASCTLLNRMQHAWGESIFFLT